VRIALDVSQTCVEVGGCGWIAHQLAEALTKLANPEQEIVLYHHFGDWINTSTENGYKSTSPYVSSPILELTSKYARYLWHNIDKGASEFPGQPDIIHSHNFSAPKTGDIPLVYTVHDLAFWDVPKTTTEANRLLCQKGILESLHNAQAFVFPSQFTEMRFLNFFEDIVEKNRQRTVVVPWAGRFAHSNEPKTFSENAPWLFVGSLDPRKNIRNMLQAFELYREKSSQERQLLIAGPRGWKTNFEAKHIESLERRGWVKHLGYLENSVLVQLYKNAFAFVWTSLYEGFGLPVVEAMSQGTPVITSHRASLPEVGGAAAIYCDPESIESIANAMLNLEENDSHYSAISKDSLQQSQKFSWQNAAHSLLEVYNNLL